MQTATNATLAQALATFTSKRSALMESLELLHGQFGLRQRQLSTDDCQTPIVVVYTTTPCYPKGVTRIGFWAYPQNPTVLRNVAEFWIYTDGKCEMKNTGSYTDDEADGWMNRILETFLSNQEQKV